MNKQRFKQIVNDYHHLSEEDVSGLHQLVKDYPYSQILHTLVAKVNNDQKSSLAQQTLNYAAMYASDRSVLKEVIQKKPDISSKTVETDVLVSTENIDKNQGAQETGKEKESPEPALKKNKPITVDRKQLSRSSDDLIEEVWRDLAELKRSKANYLTNPLVASDTVKPKVKSTTKSKADPKKKATTKVPVNTGTKSSKPKTKRSTKITTAKPKTPDEKKIGKEPVTLKISLKSKAPAAKEKSTSKNTTPSASSRTRKAPSKTSEKTSIKKTQTKSSTKAETKKKTTAQKKKTIASTKVESQQEIIERFIDKEPRISAKTIKSTEANQRDLSEKSTVYNEDLVSENLAQILLAQGKKDKALDIYKKLIWKFPQKKSYFAAQIEEIQK
ncbi:MAG: hypothetical protein AAF693_07150 [Bacteroidota bacterium]